MTDNSPEARAVRRRWINLGEFVAVAGLVVSGLAVLLGRKLSDRLPIPLIRRVAAGLFLVFAVFAAVETVRTLTS